jgi:hypothetical protein
LIRVVAARCPNVVLFTTTRFRYAVVIFLALLIYSVEAVWNFPLIVIFPVILLLDAIDIFNFFVMCTFDALISEGSIFFFHPYGYEHIL